MVGVDSTGSPLERVADGIGDEVVGAFELLGNETRLAILLGLWEAKDPGASAADGADAVPFSELRERVGVRDSGQFNYHVDRLAGTFVRRTDDGYELTDPAEQILSAVFAGTLSDHASFEDEPIDAECYRCGGPTVVDYRDGIHTIRCTSCDGTFHQPGDESGVLYRVYRPPAGLVNRTPQEFSRHGGTWDRHRHYCMMEGACPDCSGAVSTTIHVCEHHDSRDGSVCEHCGSSFEVLSTFVCDVCKLTWRAPAWSPIFTHLAVRVFFYERGLDHDARYDAFDTKELVDAIAAVDVTGTDPLEVTVRVVLADDHLLVTLDDEMSVVDVTEPTGVDPVE